MKFDRADLIARVEAEIARREQRTADNHAAKVAEYERDLAKHVEQTGTHWAAFAKTIGRRVRAGRPVTKDHVPRELRAGYSGGSVSVWDRQPPQPHAADTHHLHLMLALLRASIDDTLSTTSLRQLGFNTASLFR